MNGPAPIDVSKLKNILGGAKAIMNKVDSGDFETGNVNLDTTVTGDQLVEGSGGHAAPVHNADRIANSRLPENIKQAMRENPIPQLGGPNHTFTLDDVSDLVEKPMPAPTVRTNRQPVTESFQKNADDTFTVSEGVLLRIVEDMVDKKISEFMTEQYNKQLTENAIKRTINTLIKEGKIKTTKKVVKN